MKLKKWKERDKEEIKITVSQISENEQETRKREEKKTVDNKSMWRTNSR